MFRCVSMIMIMVIIMIIMIIMIIIIIIIRESIGILKLLSLLR